ncbi:MAG: hypothetical protein K6B75_01105 [Lachnospiraceae bacterium]|nr:hypothetical protein [Lachnospiraceae bacterium]
MFKKNVKRMLALALAVAMVVPSAACSKKNNETPSGSTPTPTQAQTQDTESGEKASEEVKTLKVESFGDGEFVFKDSVSQLASNWNPHTYETVDDGYPLDFMICGLYSIIFNDELNKVEGKENYKGYVVVPEMAADFPVDITEKVKAEHPEYGIPADATEGYAYTVKLNPDCTWQNGVKINADTYIYSAKQLLDPQLKNYRASDYMDGDFVFANARNYYYQGTTAYISIGKTASKYLAEGGKEEDLYVNAYDFWGASKEYTDAAGNPSPKWVSIKDETVYGENVNDPFSGKMLYDTYLAPGASYESNGTTLLGTGTEYAPDFSFDKVGIYKTGEYEIVIVLGKSLAGFTLLYNLGNNWLVYEDLYEAGKSRIGETDAWANTYNTDVASTMSYGPYKLVSFQADKSMRFERNENWWGYKDGKHIYQDPEDGLIYPMYQTTAIDTQVVAEPATRKLMFLSGQLMSYGLQSEDFAEYRDSKYCYVTPDETIYFFIFNGYMDAIKQRESAADFDQTKFDLETITLLNFRKAVAVTYDKEALCTAVSPARSGGYGLIGNNYIYDPETGAKYRDTVQAKQALCDFYSVDVSKFASLDDAVASITGYDEAAAKELYKKAFEEALQKGYVTDTDNDGICDQQVQITYASSATSAFITKTLDYLNLKMNEVTAGTPFAGKISFVESAPLGNEWSTTLKNGMADTVLGGWGGSALNPFSLSDLYTNPSKQYDAKWFNSSSVSVTLNVNTSSIKSGKTTMEDVTLTLKEWSDALNGATVTSNGKSYCFGDGIADVETRLLILAKIESTVLQTYDYIPMLQNAGMSLLSQQVYYVVEDYNAILGRGGMRYMKYNYDETQWTNYINKQGGTLKY